MKTENKNELHESLFVLLTKLSSVKENSLLVDNCAVKALRNVLMTFKESGELHAAYKEMMMTTFESNNPWMDLTLKMIGGKDASISSIKEYFTDGTIDGMIDSMLG